MMMTEIGPYIEILSGFAFSSEAFNVERRGMPLVRIRDVKPGATDTYYEGPYDDRFIVRNGDLLVGMDGEFNCARWLSGDALLNQRVCCIKSISPRLDDQYLYWFLPSALKLLEDKSNFVTVKHLSSKQIRAISIPLPPISEQKRIAAVLDQVEVVRLLRQRSLNRLRVLEGSIFYEMFGDPIGNTKNWHVDRLDAIASIERGKFTPRPRNDPSYYGGTYPFIQTGDISSSGGRLSAWTQTLNDKGIKVSRSFPPGTVVIAIVGATLGMTAILNLEVYCPDSVIGIQADPNVATAEYIERILRIWRPIFVSQAPETARANMNLESLRPLEIPIPPIVLQRQFSDRVSEIGKIRASCQLSLEKIEALVASLQHRAFRGELTSKAAERELAEAS